MDLGLDDRTLRRIIAMLAGFAVLAERAGSRSFPVRWFVLSVLGYAEGVARAFVVEATHSEWPCFEDDLAPGDRPVDAAVLAWRFRVLAAVLGTLLAPEGGFDGNAAARPPCRRAACAVTFGGWQPMLNDTS